VMTKLTFDTTISYKSYFYPSAYLNPSDSILRFTSFSLQPVDNNTPLAALRFQLLSPPISTADFYSIHGYLNGTQCSVKVIGAATIIPGGPTTFSIGDSVCLSANGGVGYTYLWSTGATTQTICRHSAGTYFVTVTNAGGCSSVSDSVTVNVSSPLPIQLLDFFVKKNDAGILVGWITASEINNNYFTVQRSSEGKNWGDIRVIKGAGNSNTPKNYAIVDGNPLSGINYYRLKQTDYDGTSTYSQSEAQLFSIAEQLTPKPIVYPTPTHDRKIYFECSAAPETQTEEIEIFNSLDIQVYDHTFQAIDKSDGKLFFAIQLNSNLPAGIYILVFSGESFREIQKIILQ